MPWVMTMMECHNDDRDDHADDHDYRGNPDAHADDGDDRSHDHTDHVIIIILMLCHGLITY